jgi:type II secretory pathway pseudopilin PulG
MINKKGAMFGLDARIALAIFGALSLISGAALYSAIQEARVVSFISDAKEIEKAYEQYYLDTGERLRVYGGFTLQVQNLVEDDSTTPITNWDGPYLPYKKTSDKYLAYNDTRFYIGKTYHTTVFGDVVSHGTSTCASDCAIWLCYESIDSSLASKVILKLNNEANNSGDYARYVTPSGPLCIKFLINYK